jgi:DNA-binding IclR family transcriptional regulator
MGVLWEDQVIYIYHSEPGSQMSQALAGFHMLPAWQSVIGMSLLAAESDEELQKRFVDEQWQQLAPHIAQQRELDAWSGITMTARYQWRSLLARTLPRWRLPECGR